MLNLAVVTLFGKSSERAVGGSRRAMDAQLSGVAHRLRKLLLFIYEQFSTEGRFCTMDMKPEGGRNRCYSR